MAPCPPLSAASAVSRGTVSPLIHTATSQVTSWSGTIVAIHRRILARPGVIPWMQELIGITAPGNHAATRFRKVQNKSNAYHDRHDRSIYPKYYPFS